MTTLMPLCKATSSTPLLTTPFWRLLKTRKIFNIRALRKRVAEIPALNCKPFTPEIVILLIRVWFSRGRRVPTHI